MVEKNKSWNDYQKELVKARTPKPPPEPEPKKPTKEGEG